MKCKSSPEQKYGQNFKHVINLFRCSLWYFLCIYRNIFKTATFDRIRICQLDYFQKMISQIKWKKKSNQS